MWLGRFKSIIVPRCPTGPFTILEPQNPWVGEFHVVGERRTTDFKAPKLRKGSSGVAPVRRPVRRAELNAAHPGFEPMTPCSQG